MCKTCDLWKKQSQPKRAVVLHLSVSSTSTTESTKLCPCESEAILDQTRKISPEIDVGTSLHANCSMLLALVQTTDTNIQRQSNGESENEEVRATREFVRPTLGVASRGSFAVAVHREIQIKLAVCTLSNLRDLLACGVCARQVQVDSSSCARVASIT